MGKQSDPLEYIANIAPQGLGVAGHDVPAIDKNLPLVRFFQPVDHLEGGGLAAARGADQSEQFASGDFEADAADREGRALVIALADAA